MVYYGTGNLQREYFVTICLYILIPMAKEFKEC